MLQCKLVFWGLLPSHHLGSHNETVLVDALISIKHFRSPVPAYKTTLSLLCNRNCEHRLRWHPFLILEWFDHRKQVEPYMMKQDINTFCINLLRYTFKFRASIELRKLHNRKGSLSQSHLISLLCKNTFISSCLFFLVPLELLPSSFMMGASNKS